MLQLLLGSSGSQPSLHIHNGPSSPEPLCKPDIKQEVEIAQVYQQGSKHTATVSGYRQGPLQGFTPLSSRAYTHLPCKIPKLSFPNTSMLSVVHNSAGTHSFPISLLDPLTVLHAHESSRLEKPPAKHCQFSRSAL